MLEPLANKRALWFVGFSVERSDEIFQGDVSSTTVREHGFEHLVKWRAADFVFERKKEKATFGPCSGVGTVIRVRRTRQNHFFLAGRHAAIEFRNEVANAFGASITAILDGLSLPAGIGRQGVHGKRILIERHVSDAAEPGVGEFEIHVFVKLAFGHSAGYPGLLHQDGSRQSPAAKALCGNDTFKKTYRTGAVRWRAVFGFVIVSAHRDGCGSILCNDKIDRLAHPEANIASARVNFRFHVVAACGKGGKAMRQLRKRIEPLAARTSALARRAACVSQVTVRHSDRDRPFLRRNSARAKNILRRQQHGIPASGISEKRVRTYGEEAAEMGARTEFVIKNESAFLFAPPSFRPAELDGVALFREACWAYFLWRNGLIVPVSDGALAMKRAGGGKSNTNSFEGLIAGIDELIDAVNSKMWFRRRDET